MRSPSTNRAGWAADSKAKKKIAVLAENGYTFLNIVSGSWRCSGRVGRKQASTASSNVGTRMKAGYHRLIGPWARTLFGCPVQIAQSIGPMAPEEDPEFAESDSLGVQAQ